MNEEEAALFAMTLAALNTADTSDGSASRGFIESAEPMTATCTVERSDSEDSTSASSVNDSPEPNREEA